MLAALLTVLNIGLALHNAWKAWKGRVEKLHALDAPIRDIAAALRERPQPVEQPQPFQFE